MMRKVSKAPAASRAAVYLRTPTPADARAYCAAVRRSAKLHGPWVAPPTTAARFRGWLGDPADPRRRLYLVCRREDQALVGSFIVSEIVRGSFQSAFLGYYAFLPQARQGLMAGGLRLLLREVFLRLKLHRLEANIQPGNLASIALARGAGFRLEGYSPRYLKVAGRWRDHERWAILAEDWKANWRA
ncbi:diamine N-acetyltransferase [Burkholderiales bacterium]|nr:diamine N-acetyltransferase [Burkholderiales bacterium]